MSMPAINVSIRYIGRSDSVAFGGIDEAGNSVSEMSVFSDDDMCSSMVRDKYSTI